MLTGLLPIGSVVLLKNSSKKVMIIGFCQKDVSEPSEEIIWDYAGCLYPEGYMGPDKTFLFNDVQIERIFSIGYQDEEQFAFKVKLDNLMKELKEVQEEPE